MRPLRFKIHRNHKQFISENQNEAKRFETHIQ